MNINATNSNRGNSPIVSAFLIGLVFAVAGAARATELTFQIYNEAGKTTRYADNVYGWNEPNALYSYGDNVTTFNDPTSHGGKYFTYGSAGGPTPGITVTYNEPSDSGTRLNQFSYGDFWARGLGAVTLYSTVYVEPGRYTFTPSSTTAVVITSFEAGGYQQGTFTRLNRTFAIIEDLTGTNWAGFGGTVLWGGISNQTITGAGTHTLYSPSVTGQVGHALSFVWDDQEGNIAFSNFQFSEVPEPSVLAICSIVGATMLLVRRRGNARKA